MIEEIELDGRKLVLVGTAHVSSESVDDVQRAIEKYDPGRVCVELDESRLSALREKNVWKERDVAEAIREGQGYLMLFNVVLSIYQRRIGEEYDIEPGAEMLGAVEAGESAGKEVELIDRDINVTLKRAMSHLGLVEKMRLFMSVFEGFFADEGDIDVEELKQKDVLHEVFTEFAGRFPNLKRVLIDERDSYMAERLRNTEEDVVLAVVGAGHLEGIRRELEEPAETEDLEETGGSVDWLRAVKYGFPALVAGIFVYGFFNLGAGVAGRMFVYWFLLNGVLAVVGAIIALAHPFTVIVSFFAAPFTSVNPAVPAGLVAAYSENAVRKPRVEDMESLGTISSYRDLWGNRATKLLLIFFLVNLGSAIGSFTGAGVLAGIAGLF